MVAISQIGMTNRKSWRVDSLLIAVLFILIGLWYAGGDFCTGFDSALPSAPAGGGTAEMLPGDQFEQFYRHTLPYYNFQRNNSLYYSGYQYSLGEEATFYEGWIFLPFSLLTSLLAVVFGPIAAYNLVALLSFPIVGIFGYMLGREVGDGSRLSGYVAAALLALLPFRVSFLFGEMVYATDFALLPLSLFAFIRFLKTFEWRWSALFFLTMFLLSAANFVLLYWFVLLFGPLFLLGAYRTIFEYRSDVGKWVALFASAMPSLLLMAWHLLTVLSLLSSSGLSAGQDISEIRTYSPGIESLFIRWSGNEKTIYLGFAGLLAFFGWLLVLTRRISVKAPVNRLLMWYCIVTFPLSYILALGLTFDDLTGIGLYSLIYEIVPGVRGSRTPGRLMPVVALSAAILIAGACSWIESHIMDRRWRVAAAVFLTYVIAVDFHFSDARMSTVVGRNNAYAAVSKRGDAAIVAIPFQREADHYLNATFQYFALINNVRLVNGHSSMYPKEWDAFADKFYDHLNRGIATRADLADLGSRGVRYIAVHNTNYPPNVSLQALSSLARNPALRRVSAHQGVTIFEVIDPARAPSLIEQIEFAEASNTAKLSAPDFTSGWYAKEIYPGQEPFRWMAGVRSVVLLPRPDTEIEDDYVFRYKCPAGGLTIEPRGSEIMVTEPDPDGWTTVVVDTHPDGANVLTFRADNIFTVDTDTRRFGCMVSEIVEKSTVAFGAPGFSHHQAPAKTSTPDFVAGWYAREVYPDQIPFRWMAGTESTLVLPTPEIESGDDHVIRYKCPLGDLTLEPLGLEVTAAKPEPDGWTTVIIDTHPGEANVLRLRAARIYTVDSDTRQFGCMVSDVSKK